MANPKKLPKWAIKQAGGINKKAWALARRGRSKTASKPRKAAKKPARKRSRSVAKKSNPGKRPEKIGAVLKGARAGDTISGPAQGVLVRGGGVSALQARYDNKDALVTSVSGAATGLIRNVITSKSGAYRGVSQNKILSYVQVLSPEIIAATETSPLADPATFNATRHIAHEGYNPDGHNFSLANPRLRSSAILQGLAWAAQKVAQKLGVNKMLPKGVNL